MCDLERPEAEALDCLEDVVRGSCPAERFRVGVVGLDELTDIGFQVLDRPVHATSDLLYASGEGRLAVGLANVLDGEA